MARRVERPGITIKNATEVAKMRDAGRIVVEIHRRIESALVPGISTRELDAIAKATMDEFGAQSSFLGYGEPGFPGHICTSVNEEIVHGIPGRRVLMDGDIISVDVGVHINGFHGDSAWTYAVGTPSAKAVALLRATEEALAAAVLAAQPGGRLGAVSHAVEAYAMAHGFGLVQDYGGHGIGRQMHEDPHVPNHGDPTRGTLLRPGLTLAIEPMLTTGSALTRVLDDKWTVVTADGSLAAHFEHTVVITTEAAGVLTERPVPLLH